LDLRKTTFVLDELITECCEELQSDSQKHQLITEGDKHVEIYADKNRLEQVIVNLISNAVKYSPDADKVIIKVEKLTAGIKISVTDFGIGIPKDKIEHVFDRFYRVDENSRKYAGLGLGLYISSEIVKRHQGHIHIESEDGKGSTFWFDIPQKEV
jgi:two-component system CheB/CheR fusion protein